MHFFIFDIRVHTCEISICHCIDRRLLKRPQVKAVDLFFIDDYQGFNFVPYLAKGLNLAFFLVNEEYFVVGQVTDAQALFMEEIFYNREDTWTDPCYLGD